MTGNRGLLLVLSLTVTALAEAGDETAGAPPSLELLEYLAEFVEDDNGRLIDPMEQVDRAKYPQPGARGPLDEWIKR